MNLRWSDRAVRDLREIRAYISQPNPTAAETTARTLLAAVETLSTYPNMGRPGRLAHTRELVVLGTPYVIPYRVAAGRIEIIAVLHGAQRWPTG